MVKIKESARIALEKEIKKGSWPNLKKECCRYARCICRRKRWQGVNGGVPPGGYDAEDFVEVVILKTLSGKLRCEQEIELKVFLFQSIKWEILGLARKTENKLMRAEQYFEQGSRFNNVFDWITVMPKNPKILLSELEEEEKHEILIGFLDFVKEDIALFRIAKIFILPGVVYPECFLGVVDDIDELITDLELNGYVNKDGEVQSVFWRLKDYSSMKLCPRFYGKKRKVYAVILKSLLVERPMQISSWLHIDVTEIYEIRRRMGRSILRYFRTRGFKKEDLI